MARKAMVLKQQKQPKYSTQAYTTVSYTHLDVYNRQYKSIQKNIHKIIKFV